MNANNTKCTEPVGGRKPVWSWTDAIAAASVPPLTKLVCLNIARYLSSAGKGWDISIEQMMLDTGLSNRPITTHLRNAAKAELLTIKRNFDPATGYRTVTTYRPRFPDSVTLATQPAEMADARKPSTHVGRRPGVPRTSRRLSVPRTRQVPSQEGKPIHEKGDLYGSGRGVGAAASATDKRRAWGLQ